MVWAGVAVAAGREDQWVSVEKADVSVLCLNDLGKIHWSERCMELTATATGLAFQGTVDHLLGYRCAFLLKKWKFPFRDVGEIKCYFLLLRLDCKRKRYESLSKTGLIPLPSPMRSEAGFWFSRHSRVCQSRKNIVENYPTFLFQNWI